MDGERIIATDRYSLVTVPCAAESIYKPITVPAGIVAPLLKDESDTFIGINDDMLLMMPDESTQIKCVIYAADFPNVEKAMRRDHSRQVMFYKNQFNDMIQRMLNLVKSDRAPLLIMEIGNEELVVRTADPEMGAMEDAIEVPGQCIHDLHKVFVAPDRINKAIISSPNEQVTLHYEPSDAKAFLRIDGGSGYEAWVATRTGAKS
jgi:DNA polymerase III sliding clamp (beta) subunit (PCNA family)